MSVERVAHCVSVQLWPLTKVKLITSVYAAEEAQRNLKQLEQRKRLEKLFSTLRIIAVEHSSELIPPGVVLYQTKEISYQIRANPVFLKFYSG